MGHLIVCRRKDNSDEAALICTGRLFHARAAATRKARSPRVTSWVGGISSVVMSAEHRWRRATNSDVGRRLSARYADAVPCTQWYARTHNRNWIRSGTRNQWRWTVAYLATKFRRCSYVSCMITSCAAEMAVRYAALCACRKVHTWRWPISENRSFSILDVRS